MTGGTVQFFVNGVECPDTNGVGVNAIGGVFNCDLEGNHFEARCTEACTPFMAVYEIELFTRSALTADPDGVAYFFRNNV